MIAMVAHSASQPEQAEEAEANAKLITAAPDLLIAAQLVILAWESFIKSFSYEPGIGDIAENLEFQEMNSLRSAIAKATA